MKRPGLIVIAGALLVGGMAAVIAGCLPYERLQSFGALVRRADDFTTERFARYRHVCWFFAVVCAGLAGVLWRRARSEHRAADQTLAVSQPTAGEALSGGWLLWLIVAIGVVLRMQRLFDPVAYDEAYTYLNFASRPWYEAVGDYNTTNNHLLNTLLMHVSTRIFGPQEWAMRWHVMLAGSVLPIAVYVWGREWLGRPAGLIAAAAVAVSPMLITYSTDARGYMLVALAAIVFDLSLGRLARDAAPIEPLGPSALEPRTSSLLEPRGLSPRPSAGESSHWWLAWGALVFGLCSMPLMVYAAVGSAAWFVLSPLVERREIRAIGKRLRTISGIGLATVPVVAAFYAPAYIFRGMMFLNDPVVRAADAGGFGAALLAAWRHAFEWWTDGIVPGWIWGTFAVVGVAVMPGVASRWRWFLPFAVVLALNAAQHVAPPPRIYMHLAPWLFLSAAMGVHALTQRVKGANVHAGVIVAMALLAAGGLYARSRIVLFNFGERKDYASVPEVIGDLERDLADHPDERCVLLAPLPCDLPSIFYLRRAGIELPVNVRPQSMDRVYLIVPAGATPDEVLATPLLNMADVPFAAGWLEAGTFRSRAHGQAPLTLYVSICAASTERE